MENVKTFDELEVGDFINNLKQWGGIIVKKHDDGETVTIREMVWDDETSTEVEGDLAERTYDGYNVWTDKEEEGEFETAQADEQDGALGQALTMLGITGEVNVMTTTSNLSLATKKKLATTVEGVTLFIAVDDFLVTMFRDGKVIAGFYSSNRGSMWQAGLYVVDGEKMFWADNLGEEAHETLTEGESTCGEVAREAVKLN